MAPAAPATAGVNPPAAYVRANLTLRREDAELLRRLAWQRFSVENPADAMLKLHRGERPSASMAVRYLIDLYLEQLRGGEGHDRAQLHWLRTGEELPGYRELLQLEGGQDLASVTQGLHWKLYEIKVGPAGPIYYVQWRNNQTGEGLIQSVGPGQKPEPPKTLLPLGQKSRPKKRS